MSRKYLVWSDIFPYVQSLTILVQRIKKKVNYTQTWNDETWRARSWNVPSLAICYVIASKEQFLWCLGQ